jgi:hypothetical protein
VLILCPVFQVLEYDRLVGKLEKMTFKVRTQRVELRNEVSQFRDDIDQFANFANFQVHKFQELLSTNREFFKISQYAHSTETRHCTLHSARRFPPFSLLTPLLPSCCADRERARMRAARDADRERASIAPLPKAEEEEDDEKTRAAAEEWGKRSAFYDLRFNQIARILGVPTSKAGSRPPSAGLLALRPSEPPIDPNAVVDDGAGGWVPPNTEEIIARLTYYQSMAADMQNQIEQRKKLIADLQAECVPHTHSRSAPLRVLCR